MKKRELKFEISRSERLAVMRGSHYQLEKLWKGLHTQLRDDECIRATWHGQRSRHGSQGRPVTSEADLRMMIGMMIRDTDRFCFYAVPKNTRRSKANG